LIEKEQETEKKRSLIGKFINFIILFIFHFSFLEAHMKLNVSKIIMEKELMEKVF